MGSADHLGKMDEKFKKRKHGKKEQFSEWGENGAVLTTYLLRYSSECTIS